MIMTCLLGAGLATAQTSPLIPAGSVGNQLLNTEIDCAEGSAPRWFDFTQDALSPNADIYFGDVLLEVLVISGI